MIELKIFIDELDYGDAAKQAVAAAIKHLAKHKPDSKVLPVLKKMGGLPGGAVKAMVNALPQDTQDALALALLSSYKEELVDQLNRFAGKKGVKINISDIQAEKI